MRSHGASGNVGYKGGLHESPVEVIKIEALSFQYKYAVFILGGPGGAFAPPWDGFAPPLAIGFTYLFMMEFPPPHLNFGTRRLPPLERNPEINTEYTPQN